MSTIYPTNTELDMKGICSRHKTKSLKSPLITKTPTHMLEQETEGQRN